MSTVLACLLPLAAIGYGINRAVDRWSLKDVQGRYAAAGVRWGGGPDVTHEEEGQ